jgi:transposase-like protein
MEFTTCYCPHPQCTHYGQRGFGTHLVRCGADRGIPRLLCTMCQGTFSVRQGTAYFGIRVEEPNYTIAMRALAEGNSLRGTGRIVDVDKDTVCDWVDRWCPSIAWMKGRRSDVDLSLGELGVKVTWHTMAHQCFHGATLRPSHLLLCQA